MRLRWLVPFLLLTVLLPIVSSAQSVERLRIGVTSDESTINPYTYVTGYPGWNLLLLQYDTLYQFDADGVPNLGLFQIQNKVMMV